MKRILFVLLDILSAAFLIGGYVIQYFTKNKLGMVRWVNFQERKTREAVPVDILKYAAVIVVLLLAVIIIREFLKKRLNLGRLDGVMVAVMVILVAGYLGATLFVTIEVTPAYFMVLPMIGAAALLQVIRSGIAVWTCRDEK
ncbi:MAG: hypothetical protein Q4C52_03625 [Eubacteriales bacterium]|nr:hypothetical protein [Eubacteriales bacterium]